MDSEEKGGMDISRILWAILLSVLPISELRGAIPYALYGGMNVFAAFFLCVAANALVYPLLLLFLSTLHRLLEKWSWYSRTFDRLVERARRKVHDKVEKYGYWGLAVFVAIPFPLTGAWTGSLGAWILGMNPRKSFLAVTAGVVVAGIVVTLVAYFGIKGLSFFIKSL
jgi:uncharacterized membrane protein